MTNSPDRAKPDPLWDPTLPGDPQLQRMQALLAAYASKATNNPFGIAPAPIYQRPRASLSPAARRRRRWVVLSSACGIALLLITWSWLRLQWPDRAPWSIQGTNSTLAVGATLTASSGAQIKVARIGQVVLQQGSEIALASTRTGYHRVVLMQGRLRARIWAPPGHFGIRDGDVEILDLGCEFDVEKDTNGKRRVSVQSGWVAVNHPAAEVLLPAGYELDYTQAQIGLPVPISASPALSAALSAVSTDPNNTDAQQALANSARSQQDAYALLAVLTRYPRLAEGPVYNRYAELFAIPIDAHHRNAFSRGSVHAINAWWNMLPRQPKQWWREWRDLF